MGTKKAKRRHRQAFSRDDLDILFAPKNLPPNRNHQLIMLTALYSGATLTEIARLKGIDVVTKDGIHCFQIETAASSRLVPLHPVLIDAGIVALAAERGDGLLFDSPAPSKAIMRNIRRHIDDPDKVFLSFRASFLTLLMKAGASEEVSRLIVGLSVPPNKFGFEPSVGRLGKEIAKIEGRWMLPTAI